MSADGFYSDQEERDAEALVAFLQSVDRYIPLNGVVYTLGALQLGVSGWKSLMLGILAMIATKMHYGRRVLVRVGVGLALVAGAIWAEIIPPLNLWVPSLRAALGPLT